MRLLIGKDVLTMERSRSRARRLRDFFAVASLGRDRWHWVVWPSLELVQSQGLMRHLAQGCETTKAAAVERAMEVAGADAVRVAARYAMEHHRQLAGERRAARRGKRAASARRLGAVEVLYHDDPLFFTTTYQERAMLHGRLTNECLNILGLSLGPPLTRSP